MLKMWGVEREALPSQIASGHPHIKGWTLDTPQQLVLNLKWFHYEVEIISAGIQSAIYFYNVNNNSEHAISETAFIVCTRSVKYVYNSSQEFIMSFWKDDFVYRTPRKIRVTELIKPF